MAEPEGEISNSQREHPETVYDKNGGGGMSNSPDSPSSSSSTDPHASPAAATGGGSSLFAGLHMADAAIEKTPVVSNRTLGGAADGLLLDGSATSSSARSASLVHLPPTPPLTVQMTTSPKEGRTTLQAAPVTDKLLGMLGTSSIVPPPTEKKPSEEEESAEKKEPPAKATTPQADPQENNPNDSEEAKPPPPPAEEPARAPPPAEASSSSYGGFFGGWFGGGGSSAPAPTAAPPPEPTVEPAGAESTTQDTANDDVGKPAAAAAASKAATENGHLPPLQKEEVVVPDSAVDAAPEAVAENNGQESPPADIIAEAPESEPGFIEGDKPVAKPPAAEEKRQEEKTVEDEDAPPPTLEVEVPQGEDNAQDDSKSPATVVTTTIAEPNPEEDGPPAPPADEVPVAASAPDAKDGEEEEEEEKLPARKEMNEQDKKALEEAFHASETPQSAVGRKKSPTGGGSSGTTTPPLASGSNKPRGMGQVHPDTPIPSADVALRLLRKFAHKTRPKVTTNYGGSKPRGIFNYIFGSSKEDPTFVPYRELMDVLYEEGEDREIKDDSEMDQIVDGMFGEQAGDSMARARHAVAAFVCLFSQWAHASSHQFDSKDAKTRSAFSEMFVAALDAAAHLAAHGCLDDVQIGMDAGGGLLTTNSESASMEYLPAGHLLAQSVFSADLTLENTELAAMKFLLGAGCRVAPRSGTALVRGSHLLQTIRTFYHVFLTTESTANKTTARAALQQLVTSVFARMAKVDDDHYVSDEDIGGGVGGLKPTKDKFPSDNHRDAFLVLRSICKLSMRSLPEANADSSSYSLVGLQSSGSNETWDGSKQQDLSEGKANAASPRGPGADDGGASGNREHAQLIYTAALHPALESKILALELILYVLQNTSFSQGFIQRSGPQFHAAIRSYLCVSLLKNCTSDNTRVVNLSLRIFVPLVRNFRTILKHEIEAFVTNVFFVILESKNSPAEHKGIVVKTFNEICSDPATLAEIFLNYDCDLSAVDLFHRIVNALSKVARTGFQEPKSTGISFMGGPSAARMEKFRIESRELRLDAMRALRQVLASLHASIVEPMSTSSMAMSSDAEATTPAVLSGDEASSDAISGAVSDDSMAADTDGSHNLVEMYGSKKKRRAEESEVILRFNQKPSAGIAYAGKCGHINIEDPVDVARYLLKNKDTFDKTQIGEYLGREAEYQGGFSIKVMHEYVRLMDFSGLLFDDAIRLFLSGFRLPGEAQKIDRIMEKFAERFTEQNPDVFPSADVAFILAFSVIMLQTDLHNPAIKEERRMTKDGFVRNNRGICDGKDLPREFLTDIYDRIKMNPFSLKEDDEARERAGENKGKGTSLPAALSPASFFASHYDEMDRARESNFQKERDHIVRTTESLLKRRRHVGLEVKTSAAKTRAGKQLSPRHPSKFVLTGDSGLRDEYVAPMFEVTWGPALASFSTAMESANGTMGALLTIASEEELEIAAENAAETIEVCLTGFRFAICTAGLVGNDTARDAYMLALSRFSQLGTGVLLEPRHVRCIQTMLSLAREDGELLGGSWQHVFRALSEINRFHQLFHLMARNDRAAAAAAERRRQRLREKEARREARDKRRAAAEDGDSVTDENLSDGEYTSEIDSLAESDLFSDDEDFGFDDDMDAKAVDEANARLVYEGASEAAIEAIYERSSSLSAPAVKEFVLQLCSVSRMEIAVGGQSGEMDLNQVAYRQQHALLSGGSGGDQFHHSQPNIYNLQKLVEVAHYNMDSRPRMIFAELWSTIANHLTGTALHSNPALAMYAVDSFRQLSIQFLQRDELEVFEFQRRFLKPLETVMGRSDQASTKELLLNCVDRIIQVFDTDESVPEGNAPAKQKGGLRSGWHPILAILGLGGRDSNKEIADASFAILSNEIKRCMTDKQGSHVLMNEHFVETVDALLMFAAGPHEEICAQAIAKCARLADFLADESHERPHLKRRASQLSQPSPSASSHGTASRDLEFWWPVLLGLSKSVGDPRVDLRSRALETLVVIINRHFFPRPEESLSPEEESDSIQTLQLIYRGILMPLLEFAEVGAEEGHEPPLPEDFQRFLTSPPSSKGDVGGAVEEVAYTGWLETTFDLFLDICVAICQRSIRAFKTDILIEEVFAILNSCLVADSGALAVRGIRRLEQFVTSDLDQTIVTDDVWATVSHMLRRCMAVRGLPVRPSLPPGSADQPSEAEAKVLDAEYADSVREFIAEEELLSERRYIGSNAVMVVGVLLSSDRFSEAMGFRWRLFLVAGLGRAIVAWEQAASILFEQKPQRRKSIKMLPPDYRETALYGRQWMNCFLLQLASMKGVVRAPTDGDAKSNRMVAAQKLVVDETERLLGFFLEKERASGQYRHTEEDDKLHERCTTIVSELLKGYINMGAEHLQDMAWINPILLSSCIQSKNEDIRFAVQKLVQLTSPASPSPPPTPPKKPDAPSGDVPPSSNEGVGEQELHDPGIEIEPKPSDEVDYEEAVSAANGKAAPSEETETINRLPPCVEEDVGTSGEEDAPAPNEETVIEPSAPSSEEDDAVIEERKNAAPVDPDGESPVTLDAPDNQEGEDLR